MPYPPGVEELLISVAGRTVTASLHGRGDTLVALGHGAGGNRRTGMLVRLAEALERSGRSALLFNFPYTERRARVPDPPAVLEATVCAVAEHARAVLGKPAVVLGGKSMGGRIASQAVAKGLAAEGLVFLGYPLHAPGKPEALRDAHLGSVAAPMLFVQGTRDAFARWDLLTPVIERLGDRATLLRVEEGDHSFAVPKRTGRSAADVEALVFDGVVNWLESFGR
jgi:predicted alpha/beta-hydrolase family hydrolase